MKMKEELIKKLVQVQLQWKFLHWQTYGDAKHKTYGKIYDGLGDLIDDFTEAMMGKYGRPEFEPEFALMFQDISSISIQNFMDGITEFLVSFFVCPFFQHNLPIPALFWTKLRCCCSVEVKKAAME